MFLILNDETLQIRLDAIKLLGRLAGLNPAYVLPPMRHTLLRLLIELQFGRDASSKEEATQLLCHFLRAEPLHFLVRPFIRTVVQSLPVQSNARLAAVALEALGELALVVKEDMTPYLDQLIPMTIENIQDQSSAHKREMALRALGHLCCSTGYVIKPYFQHPTLLPKILSVLREGGNAMPWSLRREVLRTFGILGALDPYRFQAIQERARKQIPGRGDSCSKTDHSDLEVDPATTVVSVGGGGGATAITGPTGPGPGPGPHQDQANEVQKAQGPGPGENVALSSSQLPFWKKKKDYDDEDDEEDDGPAHAYMFELSSMAAQPIDTDASSVPRLTATSEDYYPTVAIEALMSILRDPSLSIHHSMVTQAVIFIFKSLGMRCVPFLDNIIPNMLHVVRGCEHGLRESILQELAILASIVKHHLRPFLDPIFDLVCHYWQDYLEQCVILVEKVAAYMREDFKHYLPRVLPLVLSSLSPARVSGGGLPMTVPSNWDQKLGLVLHCLTVLRPALQEHLHIVIPALIKLEEEQLVDMGPDIVWQVRTIRTLSHLYRPTSAQISAQSLASRIIHMYHRVLERDNVTVDLRDAVLDGICTMASQLGPDFQVFAPLIDKTLVMRGIQHVKYSNMMAKMKRQRWDQSYAVDGDGIEGDGDPALQEEEVIAEYLGLNGVIESQGDPLTHGMDTAGVQRLHVNQQNLQRAWDVSQRSTSDDWGEWIRRFSLELLRESPSPALRSCSALAQVGRTDMTHIPPNNNFMMQRQERSGHSTF